MSPGPDANPTPDARPPGPEELAALPVHVVARDFPETLAVFRRLGVDVARAGGEPVAAAAPGDAGPLLDALADALAWRMEKRYASRR